MPRLTNKAKIEALYNEIKKRDLIIDKLKEENLLLMKTAFKATEKQKKAEEKLKNYF